MVGFFHIYLDIKIGCRYDSRMTEKKCGARSLRIPFGDTHERSICDDCGHIEYRNPRIIAGIVPVTSDGRILLCRRAIEPQIGMWTIPAGNLEMGETMEQGALREALEEAGITARIIRRLAEYEVVERGQIHMHYEARITDLNAATPHFETAETRLFKIDDIPWAELAFPIMRETLGIYARLTHGERVELPVNKVMVPFDAAKAAPKAEL